MAQLDNVVEDLKKKIVRCRRSQRLTEAHKLARVKCAKYLRKKYGVSPAAKHYKWDRIINTDFSAPFRCRRKLNKQNDGLWVDEDVDMTAPDVKIAVNKGFEKYSKGFMLFGGICSEGLLPRDGPVIFTEYLNRKCAEIGKEKKTMDNKIYASFIKDKFAPILRHDLNDDLDEYIWQDDCDTKHRTKHVLETVKTVFVNRIDPEYQCSKLADAYPIENVWAILYEKTRGIEFESVDTMKRFVRKVWRGIDADICNKMMASIPHRLRAIIKSDGEQITKYDY